MESKFFTMCSIQKNITDFQKKFSERKDCNSKRG